MYLAASSRVDPWLIGLIMESSSFTRAVSPIPANAMIVHIAACVYCPPFSRTPGTYPLMYPGSRADLSNGGSRSFIRLFLESTRRRASDVMACFDRSLDPAPDKTDHSWTVASIRHSSFCEA